MSVTPSNNSLPPKYHHRPPNQQAVQRKKSGVVTDEYKQNFEQQIFNRNAHVDKKDLFEYEVSNTQTPIDDKNADPTRISVTAFRKYGYGGVGTFHTYVSQYPFRGHEQTLIHDAPPDKQKVINDMKKATL